MDGTPNPPAEALGRSEPFLIFMERLSAAAKVDRPVLILGERGSGKELAAARLHFLSPRWDQPLITLNCAALTPTLIEDELFGHEPGAYTGAGGRRAGRFEAAQGGTLFLDEIGNLPLTAQEKILRVVEYGVFERLGSSQAVAVDVRVIGATNADLPALAARERFRADLLDRLAFEVLVLPPLREREGDVMLLAGHFATRMAIELGREGDVEFTPAARAALEGHAWPGNVRELKNVVERAVYRAPGPLIEAVDLDPFAAYRPGAGAQPAPAGDADPAPTYPAATATPAAPPGSGPPPNFKEAVAEYEQDLLRQALAAARWNQREAAERLGLTYHALRGLLRKYGGVDALGGDPAGE